MKSQNLSILSDNNLNEDKKALSITNAKCLISVLIMGKSDNESIPIYFNVINTEFAVLLFKHEYGYSRPIRGWFNL